MLVLDGIEKISNEELKQLLTEFRKVQVSRYPIELKTSENSYVVGFMDSRFPTDRFSQDKMTAMIWWEQHNYDANGKPTWKYTIESRLIENDKYSRHNSDFRTRSTTDPKKLFKFMKEYIKPFTSQEIAQRSFRSADNAFDDWKSNVYREFRRAVSLDPADIMEEFIRLKALGITPQTDKFKQVFEKGIPAYEEYKAINNKKFSRMHVFINFDDTVTFTIMPNAQLPSGVEMYESMEKAPQYIQEQVGMLRLVDGGKYVPNVGYKASDKEFWIEGLSQ